MSTHASVSAEGETWIEHPDGWSFQTESETRVLRLTPGGTTDQRFHLDANELLAQVARIVPEGTRLRVTVETVEP